MTETLEHMARYVLLSAAHNEEALIAGTIEAVLAQTVRPACWVIVSDRSTDRTDAIVTAYAARHPFIQYLKLDDNIGRGTRAKVNALMRGSELLRGVDYEFIGNLDADVSFAPTYFEGLLRRFLADPQLGISGGVILEQTGSEFRERVSNSVTSVAHAAQLVRRACYEQIGGYVALEYGGEDWYAEIRARSMGWSVASDPALGVFHHRPTGGAAGSMLRHRFREGMMDHSVGSHPVFELLKCARRIPERPFALGALVRFAGFVWSAICRRPRLIAADFVRQLRREQMARVTGVFSRVQVS